MLLSSPLLRLFPGARAAVLTALAESSAPLTGRQVAGVAREYNSVRAVQQALAALVDLGVVHRESVGRAHLYSLNHDHLASGAIEQLVGMRTRFKEVAARQYEGWVDRPVAVWMFGSTAKSLEKPESDLDLAIIRPDDIARHDESWERDRWEADEHVARLVGAAVETVEASSTEFADWLRRGDPLAHNILDHGEAVFGPSPREWWRSVAAL